MQTISPLSSPDDIRRERDTAQPQANPEPSVGTVSSEQSVAPQQVSGVQTEASPVQQVPNPPAQPVQPSTAAANPFSGDYQIPVITRDTSAIYPDPDKIKQQNRAFAESAATRAESYIDTQPFGVRLIAVLLGIVAVWQWMLVYIIAGSSGVMGASAAPGIFSNHILAIVLGVLFPLLSVALWRGVQFANYATAAVLAAYAAFGVYSLIQDKAFQILSEADSISALLGSIGRLMIVLVVIKILSVLAAGAGALYLARRK